MSGLEVTSGLARRFGGPCARVREAEEASPGLSSYLYILPSLHTHERGRDQHHQLQEYLAKYAENINSMLISPEEK